jgi:hypothetical protein
MPKNWTSRKGLQATGRRVVRRATASSRALPDFLVLGAQKAGTTSLGLFLYRHPDVFWTPRPELHYFDRDFDRGLSWYRSWFARRSVVETHERRTGRPARVGEKTPSYVVLPDGPTRVAAVLPGVKLVVSLRDPVSRAYSQWSMNLRTGRETLSFADALEAEPERLASVDLRASVSGTSYLEHGYAMRSRYAEQLERWLAHFDRSQLYVYRSEDLYRDPERWIPPLLDHVGVRSDVVELVMPHIGMSGRDPIDPHLRDQLIERFEPADAQLQALTGLSYYQDRDPAAHPRR